MSAERFKKIAYVTGTRADFGLMAPVLSAIQKSKKLKLALFATGMHLMPEYGLTIREVKRRFPEVKTLKATFDLKGPVSQAKFIAELMPKLVFALTKNRPDFVLILGDRPEMLTTAAVCLYLKIPTAQIHGGEKTRTLDEIARHAITKLSSLHFPATAAAAKRIEKMGEEKWRVRAVGAPALDVIQRQKLPSRGEVLKKLSLKPNDKIILVTQHPTSEEAEQAGRQMREILSAVKAFGLPAVVIYPNADPGSLAMIRVIERERGNPLFRIIKSLPHQEFLALEKQAAVWVGNSSAGLIESSSFGTPVVNVGLRQEGREHGPNVIHVKTVNRQEIAKAIKRALLNSSLKKKNNRSRSLWGDGKAATRIVKFLENVKIDQRLLTKQLTY